MSELNVELVREFFEMNGFLVRVVRKHTIASREKEEAGVDLLILNSHPQQGKANFVLTGESVGTIERAMVKVKGWHTGSFAPSLLASSPDIFDLLEKRTVKTVKGLFGGKDFRKILVVSRLPATEALAKKSISILAQRGVDHLLEFTTVLQDIIGKVKTNKNYTESDILQLIRLLKCYSLLREPQLELFKVPRRAR